MADEGCVMSGSRTQEFLLPGSIGEGSDWDIYVPGNVKSVTNMLSVLSACGVEWKWLGDDLDELISGSEGTNKVFQEQHLVNMLAWGNPIDTDYFNQSQKTKDRLRAVRNILSSYRDLLAAEVEALEEAEADETEEAEEAEVRRPSPIQVTKIRGEFDIQKVAAESSADTNGEFF
jgi:hypothetical protein